MALHNAQWQMNYLDSKFYHLPFLGSDHCPLLLVTEADVYKPRNSWKFYICWLRDPTCSQFVFSTWGSSTDNYDINQKLSQARKNLSKWNKEHFLVRLIKILFNLRISISTSVSSAQWKNCCQVQLTIDKLNYWKKVEAEFWQQKFRDR